MDNRERDRVSQRTTSTEAGDINRRTSEQSGREQNSGTSAEFGQNIGRSENLEGGDMNKDKTLNTPNVDRESTRRSGSDSYGSSSGRSSGNSGSSGISRDENRGSSPMESNRSKNKRDDISGSDDVGRHSE